EQKVNEKSLTEILIQNEIDRLLEVSLPSEIRDCVLLSVEKQKIELLKAELEKSSSVESSNSVRRSKFKDTKSKNRVLKNNNVKSLTAHVRKMSHSASIYSNARETMHLNVCQSNTSVLSTKTVNAVNDGLNIVCVSCGKDVFFTFS
ncbi:hypothetical protein Tco_1086507, partial [Tanacetum coccineum]